jgi:PAS domain-containing protein
MSIRLSSFMLAAIAAAVIGLAACGNQREPAEQAMAAIEKSLSDSGAQLQKYLPERYEAINARIVALRDAMDKEQFGTVVADAPAVTSDLRRGIADAMIERAKTRAAMEAEWNALIESMPAMITAVDRKLAVQGSRPPAGMDRDAWKALTESYDAARESWDKAAARMTRANFEETVLAGRDARTRIEGIMESLGLKAS